AAALVVSVRFAGLEVPCRPLLVSQQLPRRTDWPVSTPAPSPARPRFGIRTEAAPGQFAVHLIPGTELGDVAPHGFDDPGDVVADDLAFGLAKPGDEAEWQRRSA